eukprot:TRINITY_DN667_c0_g2_i6.p1 TRINITY_DN667_c0_g2~~TRINITY_DN667_c0_g2_i6.p1  ORF type:complete len:164 (-),score=32.74 TRINITY_DN667_c0_g2_i6:26-517(-)
MKLLQRTREMQIRTAKQKRKVIQRLGRKKGKRAEVRRKRAREKKRKERKKSVPGLETEGKRVAKGVQIARRIKSIEIENHLEDAPVLDLTLVMTRGQEEISERIIEERGEGDLEVGPTQPQDQKERTRSLRNVTSVILKKTESARERRRSCLLYTSPSPRDQA